MTRPRLNRASLEGLEAVAALAEKHLESLTGPARRTEAAYSLEDGLFYLKHFIDYEKTKRGLDT